eukprot:XP_001706955.1 Hypothetical protein GL50803_96043 [Giardia lamblia ATCC 50803]
MFCELYHASDYIRQLLFASCCAQGHSCHTPTSFGRSALSCRLKHAQRYCFHNTKSVDAAQAVNSHPGFATNSHYNNPAENGGDIGTVG